MNDNKFLTAEVNHTSIEQSEVKQLTQGEVDTFDDKMFGTFHGVFRPTILTIIGVMLYLRLGWVVGNAGLLGALLIIGIAFFITGTTALSISSITTNIRVGSGGVFSIISQSLGLEMGGAIGIPLYLAQALSAALYMHGFLEGWLFIFPDHNPYAVLGILFLLAFTLTYTSTKIAFHVQLVVMFIIVVAISTICMNLHEHGVKHPELWGSYKVEFWTLFAVFFPAATGIMVGASMSGNLHSPRKSIPKGTMAAWLTALIIYSGMALVYSTMASSAQLMNDNTIAITMSPWKYVVLTGLMASCFSATLSSLTAAPRVLQALATHKIVPGHDTCSKLHKGEPRNAMLITGAMVIIAAMAANLNTIAQILTMFFLLTYFTVNIVLLIEQSLNMISFRPEFKISFIFPLLGSISCLSAIIIINHILGLIALAFILGIYIYLHYKKLSTPWETVRSGLLTAIANWAAKKVYLDGQKDSVRAWKPDLLVPIDSEPQLEGNFRLLRAITYSQGSIHIIALNGKRKYNNLENLLKDIQRENIFATSATIHAQDFNSGVEASMTIMKGSFFNPNTIFLDLSHRTDEQFKKGITMASENQMAAIILSPHKEAGLGRERFINLWVRDQSPNWKLSLELSNLDYAVLLSYQLRNNWDARIRLISVVEKEEYLEAAKDYLTGLMELARMAKT